MSKEMNFFIYLLENYAYYIHTTSDKIINELIRLNLLDKVYNSYEFYHIESLDNAYQDIDKLIEKVKECH